MQAVSAQAATPRGALCSRQSWDGAAGHKAAVPVCGVLSWAAHSWRPEPGAPPDAPSDGRTGVAGHYAAQPGNAHRRCSHGHTCVD